MYFLPIEREGWKAIYAIYEKMKISRRDFTKIGCKVLVGAISGAVTIESLVKNSIAAENWPHGEYDWNEHYWGFG